MINIILNYYYSFTIFGLTFAKLPISSYSHFISQIIFSFEEIILSFKEISKTKSKK